MLTILFIAWWLCLPSELFDAPTATVVTSSKGQLLGARIASDGQWRFPAVDSVPYRFKECVLYFEDEYFYEHPGINPISTAKALWANLTTDQRRGGSTITQQIMRLAHHNPKRTYFEKFIESLQATRLEAQFSKDEILRLYASHSPFGGNVVGLETASWRYFGFSASELSWGQAAALAILPNAPSLIFPGKNEKILKTKRDALLKKLFQNKIIDETTYKLALDERLPGKPLRLPDVASHFTEKIREEHPGKRFQATIDYHLQRRINGIVKAHYKVLKQNQIHNMAVLVLDVKTRKVLAYVGNTPTTSENNNYVDIINKPRSTGSILKPFLFAAMLDDGDLLPNALVADIPTNIDGYTPKNYDKQYRGAVPASLALTKSLNVPAVRMLRKYGLQKFYNKLKKLNQPSLSKPANYYGLSLILGGAESSLWAVTNAYAGMASTLNFYNASSDEYRPFEFSEPVFAKDSLFHHGKKQLQSPIFGAGAIYESLNTIKNLNRPSKDENWSFFNDSQSLAWKTGTSYGFKDAWAVGVTPKYAIGVWVGNADGEGRPGLVGIKAAAPVLFDVLPELPQSGWFDKPFDDLIQMKVCKESGYLAGLYCDNTKKEWLPKKGSKTPTCPFHHPIFVTKNEQFRVNSSCYPLSKMKQKNWFALPPVEDYYYARKHPEYRPLPPFKYDCLQDGEKLMAFIYPKPNQAVILPKNFEEKTNDVIFKLAHRGAKTTVYWYLNARYIGKTENFHEIGVTPKPGIYTLTAIDQEGNELQEKVTIKEG